MQNLSRPKRRVGQVHQLHAVTRQALGQHAAEHGFAAAHLAHHHDDAVIIQHGMLQGIQNRAPCTPFKKELAVGRETKRRFVQAKVFKVERRQVWNAK